MGGGDGHGRSPGRRRLAPFLLLAALVVTSAGAAAIAVHQPPYATAPWAGRAPEAPGAQAAWLARFPDCGAWGIPHDESRLRVTLDRPGHPTFTAWTRCGPGHPGWRLFEQLGRGPVLSYAELSQNGSLMGEQPEWIEAVLPVGGSASPLVLAQVFTGTTGNQLQVFAVDHGGIHRLTLSKGGYPYRYDLTDGGDGFSLVCAVTPGSARITELDWWVTGSEPLVDGRSNPPSQPIELTAQSFVFGGNPVRLLEATPVRKTATTYAVGIAAQALHC